MHTCEWAHVHVCLTSQQPLPWICPLTVMLVICNLSRFNSTFSHWLIQKHKDLKVCENFQGTSWFLHFLMNVPVLCFSCLSQFLWRTKHSWVPSKQYSLSDKYQSRAFSTPTEKGMPSESTETEATRQRHTITTSAQEHRGLGRYRPNTSHPLDQLQGSCLGTKIQSNSSSL